MSEDQDQSQKTEEPTERKIQKAREKGQVPRSREVNNFFIILGILVCVWLAMPYLMQNMMESMGAVFTDLGTVSVQDGGVGALMWTLFVRTVAALSPILILLMVLGLFGAVVQTNGFIFSTKPIEPKLNKISPLKGVKRLFSLKSIVEFFKSFLKMVVLGVVMVIIMYHHRDTFVMLPDMSIGAFVLFVRDVVMQMLAAVLAIAALVAIVDYLYQRYEFYKEQRMSQKEIKDEIKDTIGDPHVRQRQRQIRMDRMRMRMMAEVPKAQVVVTNPTHFSVALAYDQNKDPAPRVVAMGADHIAFRIRTLARENNIPILEDPPLARALYEDAEVGEYIPLIHYEAVAKVVSYIMGLKSGRAQRPYGH